MVNLYIGNNAEYNSIVRGDGANPFIAAMVCVFWERAEALPLDVWVGRVGSKMNPSALPTRHTKLPFSSTKAVQFTYLYKILSETLPFV